MAVSYYSPFKQAFILDRDGRSIEFWGGSEFSLPKRPFDPDLLIQADDLESVAACRPYSRTSYNKEASDFFADEDPSFLDPSFPHLIINWPDMSVPEFSKVWWHTLTDRIMEMPHESVVFVCCTGGTGRTGTILSILLALATDEQNPVEFVRKYYKDRAVETQEQLNYIQNITGLVVDSDASVNADIVSQYYEFFNKGKDYSNLDNLQGEHRASGIDNNTSISYGDGEELIYPE